MLQSRAKSNARFVAAKAAAAPTLDDVVDEVVRNREPVVIHRKKKPVAVVVPIEDLELVERLESEMSSSEIFAALFELELGGKVRQMPGKNFVKSF